MLQLGGDPDLPQKAVGTDRDGQVGMENLERDGAVVADVARQKDGGHTALSQLPLHVVPVGQGAPQAVNRLHYVASRMLERADRRTCAANRRTIAPAGSMEVMPATLFPACQ